MVNYLKAKSWSHYKIQSPRTTSGSSVILHNFMPQSKALTITSVKSRSGEIRNCNCLGWSHQQHWWLDVDVASSYSHCDLALGLPGCRRQAAVANPCPTIDFIGLPLVPTAEGWPWWTWGWTGGDLPSGGKRTCAGGGMGQLAGFKLADDCCSGLDWLLLEEVSSDDVSWWSFICFLFMVSPLVVGFSGINVLVGNSGRDWNIL